MYLAKVTGSVVGLNKTHLNLFNGLQSNLKICIYKIEVISHLVANNTGVATTIYLRRTTDAGTGLTTDSIQKLNSKLQNLPSQISAVHTLTLGPTITNGSELAGQTIYTEETTGQTSKEPLFEASQFIDPITLNGGEGVCVQQQLASAGALSVFIYFKVKR